MKAKVLRKDLSQYKRIIVCSDIHGDLDGFEGLLKQVDFTQEDGLVIAGDILEKGNQSLKLLRKIMKMHEEGNLFMTLGNNDTLLRECAYREADNESIYWYMNSRKNSILIEIAEELDMPYGSVEDVDKLMNQCKEVYQNEIQFLDSFPYILDTEIATFVHAGIEDKPLDEQDIDFCVSVPNFAQRDEVFDKLVVVGHWPASNYSEGKIIVNSYYNPKMNVISIDGGNSMKRWAQINYLIFENGNMSQGWYDALPKIKALEDQKESLDSITLLFPHTEIEIIEENEEESLCFIPYINQKLYIKNKNIYDYKRKTYCSDFTTYQIEVQAGDILSLCKDEQDKIMAKKEGIVGYYTGKYECL